MAELFDVQGNAIAMPSEKRSRIEFVSFDRMVQEATQSVEQELSIEDRGWVTLGANSYDVIHPTERKENIRASRLYCVRDPLAKRAISLWTDFTFGTGMSFAAKDDETQEILEEFWNAPKNRAVLGARGQRKSCDKSLIDGEVFFVLFLGTSNETPTIRWIEPLEIESIITNPEDAQDVMFYKRIWSDPQGQSHESIYRSATNVKGTPTIDAHGRGVSFTDEGIVFHLPLNTISQRGNPLLLSALDWLKQYRKFLAARVAIMLALARFAWKVKIKGGQAAVDAQGGKLSVEDGAPAAGSTALGNEGVDLNPIKTDSAAKGAMTDGKMLKLQLFAAAQFPETYWGDVDTGNLATGKTVELPVIKMIQSNQQVWEDMFEDIDNAVLEHRGVAPDKWYVDRNWPPIAPRDAQAFTDAMSKVVGTFPALGGTQAMLTAALSALGIDDVAEVFEDPAFKKFLEDETKRGEQEQTSPEANLERALRLYTEHLVALEEGK